MIKNLIISRANFRQKTKFTPLKRQNSVENLNLALKYCRFIKNSIRTHLELHTQSPQLPFSKIKSSKIALNNL